MLKSKSTVRLIAPWICLGMFPVPACGSKGGEEGPTATSGAMTTDTPMDDGTTRDSAVTTGGPDGPDGSTGPNGSTGASGTPPLTTGPTTSGTTTGGVDGSSTDTGAADATATDDTGESSSSSSGDELPMECGAPQLDFKCFDAGDEEVLVTLDTAAIVLPMTTQDVLLDVSPCVDETLPVAGLVVDVELQDSCLWSMELSIVCPSGEALALTVADMCSPMCSPVASYHAVFRQSAEVNCSECDFNNALCIQAPVGGDYCAFLDGCQFEAGKPWALRVKTGATQVNIPTVALHLAFEVMP